MLGSFSSLALVEIDAFRERPKPNANNVCQKVRAIESGAKDHPAKTGRAESVNPVGMIKLQKLNGPCEADGDQPDPDRRATGIGESNAEKYDQRPKRVPAVFSNKIRKWKKARSPQQSDHDNQRGG